MSQFRSFCQSWFGRDADSDVDDEWCKVSVQSYQKWLGMHFEALEAIFSCDLVKVYFVTFDHIEYK